MDTYKIHPIRIGYFEKLELSTLTLMQNQGTKIEAPLIMYLIEGNKCFGLVDTGGSDETWSAKYHSRIIRPANEEPIAALREFGITPNDVSFIINTHLHWDHCFNNDLFPNAKIYIQKKELEYASNPLPAHYKFYEAEKLGFVPKWKKAEDKIVAVDGRYIVMSGVDLVPLPGHSPGFQGVLVNTKKGKCMIASDAVGLLSNMQVNSPDERISSGIICNLEDSYKSLETIAKEADFILPGHDPALFKMDSYPWNE